MKPYYLRTPTPVKYPYRVLFEHRQRLEEFVIRVQRIIDQSSRFEGHVDAEDQQDLDKAVHDVKLMSSFMAIAHQNSKLTPEEKEAQIAQRVGELHFKIGSL